MNGLSNEPRPILCKFPGDNSISINLHLKKEQRTRDITTAFKVDFVDKNFAKITQNPRIR